MNATTRPTLTPPPRKSVDPDAAARFITGATDHLAPQGATSTPEVAPAPVKAEAAAAVASTLPVEQLTLTIPAKRDHIHYTDKGRSWPFRLTNVQRKLIEFTLEHSKFKSAQQMFEVFFIGGLECYANQLTEKDVSLQEALKELLSE